VMEGTSSCSSRPPLLEGSCNTGSSYVLYSPSFMGYVYMRRCCHALETA
jgi:hypothetical protein